MNGLFQVIRKTESEKEPIVLGTAFAIMTNEKASNTYYLLTAYHVISELLAKSAKVILRDENNTFLSAQVVYPQTPLNNPMDYGSDYALLKVNSLDKIDSYYLNPFNSPQKCFVRGAASYYDTLFTTIKGEFFWNEKIPFQNCVLQLSLDTKTTFKNSSHELSIIKQQDILRGLSGSPILVKSDEKFVCAGVVGNIFPDTSASCVYGVPINTVITDCLNPLMIPLSSIQKNRKTSDHNLPFVSRLLINDPENFSLDNYSKESELWHTISDLFYQDSQFLVTLREIIDSESDTFSTDAIIILKYFYARLLFKKGLKEKALRVFADIKKDYNRISSSSKERLETLISVRSVIEDNQIKNVDKTIDKLLLCGEKINNLSSVDNLYKDNESASMYGRGLTNLFSIDYDFLKSQKDSIKYLLAQHTTLLNKHPHELQNQSVVNISLNWLLNLWKINFNYIDIEILRSDVIDGFKHSELRKNSIFYIQSIITFALEKLIENKYEDAVFLLITSSILMRRLDLSLFHEGIDQLLIFLKKFNPEYYALFEISYKYYDNKLYFLNKANLYNINVNIPNVFERVEMFYKINYKKRSDFFRIDYNTFEILL